MRQVVRPLRKDEKFETCTILANNLFTTVYNLIKFLNGENLLNLTKAPVTTLIKFNWITQFTEAKVLKFHK